MRKKFINIFLVFIFFFVFISNVHAIDDSTIDKKINDYSTYKDKLDELDCTEEDDETVVKECNDYNMKKNLIVTELMKLKDENKLPKSVKSAAEKIIKENEENCGKIFDDFFTNLINRIMKIFYIVGPILLVLFGTLDYSKAVMSVSQEALKTANKRFIRRSIATVLLFLSPVLVNIIISMNVSNYYLSGNAYACDLDFATFKKKYEINYVPEATGFSGGGGGSGSSVSGINFSTNYSGMIYKGGPLPIPFPDDNVVMASPFDRNRLHPIYGVVRPHRGVDIVGNIGTDILAVADGVVTVAAYNAGGYGYWVEIEHNINNQKFYTRYGHMRNSPSVRAGQTVTAGTVLGVQGSTGASTGDHLHFEIRLNDNSNGSETNPLPYILGKDTVEKYQKW